MEALFTNHRLRLFTGCFFQKRLWTFKRKKSVIFGDSKNLWLADAEYRCSSDFETKQKAYDTALSAMKKHIADVKRNTLDSITKCNIESL
jgi:hypothetical protein